MPVRIANQLLYMECRNSDDIVRLHKRVCGGLAGMHQFGPKSLKKVRRALKRIGVAL